MTKREIDIWDVLFWLGMAVLIAYIIAKLVGLINTPEWITNLLPLMTLAFVIGVFYQKVLGFMNKMYTRTDYLKKNLDDVSSQMNSISSKLLEHDKKLFAVEKQQEILSKLQTIKRK